MNESRRSGATAYVQPATSWVGVGAIDELPQEITRFQASHALIVTDPTLARSRLTEIVKANLADAGAECAVFDGVQRNPTTQVVDDLVDAYRSNVCDAIVTVGGGSPHDAGKAARLLLANGGVLEDYEGVNSHLGRGPPHIAVNTTAGTGAELSHYCFITDPKRGRRLIIFDRHIAPDVNISDAELHAGMPAKLTAETGMNALSHAIEATLSTAGNAYIRAVGLRAIRLLADNLPRAYANGNDMHARENVAQAEYMAGLAYNSAGFGLADSLAMSISTEYHASHSALNAIMLPGAMRYNLLSAQTRLSRVAQALGEPVGLRSERDLAQAAIDAVERMNADLGIGADSAVGTLDDKVLEAAADAVLKHPFNVRSPRPVTRETVHELLTRAIGASG